MLKLGGVVILMHQCLDNIDFLIGSKELYQDSCKDKTLKTFSKDVLDFFADLSKELLGNKEAKNYADIVTFAFWIRRASIEKYKELYLGNCRYGKNKNILELGRGMVFHIAPSNVPVNYAYSLAVGLLTGNRNIVRVSTKDFEQVNIINNAIINVLEKYDSLKPYLFVIRYTHSKEITDELSANADVRIIWGGDKTIDEIKKSELPHRAREVLFADRYSLAVIDSNYYINMDNKEKLALEFYNDTYMTDQNACTSPRIVIWTGNRKQEAKELFWDELFEIVKDKYDIKAVQAVDKLVNMCIFATNCEGERINKYDNRLVRINVKKLSKDIMEYKGNSGFFYEYDCDNITDLKTIINDKCQTISYCGNKNMFDDLLEEGISGIDRIVPIGKTMDFDFVWDGYDLYEMLTRKIVVLHDGEEI